MINKLIILPAIIFLFILTGCSVTQYHYTSTAHVPHLAVSTETVMNVMDNEENSMRAYGVIAAVDEGTNNYLLIAPTRDGRATTRNQISNFNITQATYIDLDAAQEFSNALRKIIREWDNLRDDDGYFYEFASAPEIEVEQLGDELISYAPSIRFFFNVTNEGSTGVMIIEHYNKRTNEAVIRRIGMNRKRNVEDLQSLLQQGIEYFN